MASKFDIRQNISHDTLTRTTGAAGSQADLILRAIDSEITPPLALSVTGANRVVTIGSITVSNPTTALNRSIPPISSLLPSFTSGTVTLDATGAGNATPSVGSVLVLGMVASQFMQIGISIDATGSLTLTKGTAASSLAAAGTPASVSGLFGIGMLVVRTDVSNNIANVLTSDLTQYVGGGGSGGGSGSTGSALDVIKNALVDSPYQLVTPNIIANDGQSKFASLTGATYDIATTTIKFNANAQVAVSSQMLDTNEFLGSSLDVGSVDLSVFWNKGSTVQAFSIPTAFTYEVSRDGGNNWFTTTMARIGTTEVFRGNLLFQGSNVEASNAVLASQSSGAAGIEFNATTQQAVGQKIVLANAAVALTATLNLKKTGSPSGNYYVSIIKDVSGSPSTLLSDVLGQSNAITAASLSTSAANVIVTIPNTVLPAGTYHLVLTTDQSYKTSFSAGVTSITWNQLATTTSGAELYSGTWAAASASAGMNYALNGRTLDLRVRVTSAGSPTYPCGLDGYGIFYNLQDVGIVGASRKTQRFVFNSVTDNTSTFAITTFSPDPDLLTCFWVEGGQAFKVPGFNLNGSSAVFPANAFNNGGISQTITLIFDQNSGGAFDNSDSNGRLLTANHLGSSSGADDKSVVGRGIVLRRPDGTLREIALDDNDNIVIISVP